jgi:hypothetical protein
MICFNFDMHIMSSCFVHSLITTLLLLHNGLCNGLIIVNDVSLLPIAVV